MGVSVAAESLSAMPMKSYSDLVSRYSHAFSVDEVDEWLSQVEDIESFSDIESLFSEKGRPEDFYMAIKVLYARKYLRSLESTIQREDTTRGGAVGPNDVLGSRFSSYGNRSEVMDFSPLDALELIHVWSCRNLRKITVPANSDLKALELNNLARLDCIEVAESESVRCLSIAKCNRVSDFSFIGGMKNLLYVNLAGNRSLRNIDFLEGHRCLVMLHLNMTGVLKSSSTVDVLRSIPNLSYLLIQANKKESETLREALPNCVGSFRW